METRVFRKILRFFGWTIATLFVVSIVSTLIALWAYRDISAETLEAKYANDASRFMNIEGVRIHYRDRRTARRTGSSTRACKFCEPAGLGALG